MRARHTAIRLLERYPELGHASFATEIVCGDVDAVGAALAARPELAAAKVSAPSAERSRPGGGGRWLQRDMDRNIGAKGWEPLLYLCFTRLSLAAANDNAMTIARMLLDRGADPNVFFMAGDSRYTSLVGAIGEGEEDRPPHPHRDALVRLLLERGAEPYDIQVVYNIHFHGKVLWFLELIYERSVQLGRQADWDNPDWPMLDMGGYGNGARWHLWIAIQNNDVRLAEWCLIARRESRPGAAAMRRRCHSDRCMRRLFAVVARKSPNCSLSTGRSRSCGRAPERRGVRRGGLSPRYREAAQSELSRHPELVRDARPMLDAARRDRRRCHRTAPRARRLARRGEPAEGARRCTPPPTPMHCVAAELLIARGAEIDPVESNWNNTPLASAIYAQHLPMIELLGRYSRDMWELVYSGRLERVRELLAENPELAKQAGGGHTLLMWLPPQDERLALEIARLLLRMAPMPSLAQQ